MMAREKDRKVHRSVGICEGDDVQRVCGLNPSDLAFVPLPPEQCGFRTHLIWVSFN